MGKPNLKDMYPALYAAVRATHILNDVHPVRYQDLDPETQRKIHDLCYQFFSDATNVLHDKVLAMTPDEFEEYTKDR